MKAYVAGPFFNEDEISSMLQIENILEKYSVEMFRPRYDAGQISKLENASFKDIRRVFENDINGINTCDVVIANLTYKDTGTSFEIGYAYAKHIPVILFNDESRSKKKLNLMLASVADNYFNSIDEMIAFFEHTNTNTCEDKVNRHEIDLI